MKKILSLIIYTISCCAGVYAQTPEGKFFTSFDGTKIYYEVKGNGFPVILLHGFTGTGQGWKNGSLYPALINAGYGVVILDQRGNGQSDKPHTDEGYNNDAEAKAVMGGMGQEYTNPEWPRRIHAYQALMGDTTVHDVDDMMVWIRKNNFDNLALAYQQKHQPSTSAKELAGVKIP